MIEIKIYKTNSSYGNYYFKIGERFYYFMKKKEASEQLKKELLRLK